MTGLFDRCDPHVRAIYDAVRKAVSKFGKVRADEKKTSIHLVAKTGFAGIHLRKSAILLNIRTAKPIKSKRVRKVERVSANRYHNEMLIGSPAEVNAEVIGWLREAYSLGKG